jgi:hypothetical protein
MILTNYLYNVLIKVKNVGIKYINTLILSKVYL